MLLVKVTPQLGESTSTAATMNNPARAGGCATTVITFSGNIFLRKIAAMPKSKTGQSSRSRTCCRSREMTNSTKERK